MLIVAIVVGFGVLLGLVSLVVALRLQRRWYAGTGLDEWRATRRALPWRDWLSIVVAQSRGRPVTDPRLTEAAHVRGAFARAGNERMLAPASPMRRLRWMLVGLAAVQVALALLSGVEGEPVDRTQLVLGLCNLVLWFGFFRFQASGMRRIERSLDGTPSSAADRG